MHIPNNLLYTKSHEWYEFKDETTATVGITDYAQNMLGDIVFINLPDEDSNVEISEIFADIESVKTAADIYCSVIGKVTKVNSNLIDRPELINEDAYEAWIAEISHISEKEEFLSAEQYEEYLTVEELL